MMMVTMTASKPTALSPSRKRKARNDASDGLSHPPKKNFVDQRTDSTTATYVKPDQSLTRDTPHSLRLDISPSAKQELNPAGKPALPISPGTNSLSQISQSSDVIRSPSTAPSSVAMDHGADPVAASKDRKENQQPEATSSQPARVNNMASPSPSIASVDGAGRSSGRARKPTSKAQALADAGTKFYQDLKRNMDESISEHGAIDAGQTEPELVEEDPAGTKQDEPASNVTEGSLLTSVETPDLVRAPSPSPTQLRSSSRQRKPTAKAAAAEPATSPRKRTASPLDNERASKIHRTGMNTPREPSKLRQSLSSIEDDVHEDDPVNERVVTAKANEVAPKTVADPISLDSSEVQRPITSNDIASKDEVQPVNCDLTCLPPELILLAFARYAANDTGSDDQGDQSGEDDQINFDTGNVVGNKSPKMSKDVVTSIIQGYCACTATLENAEGKNPGHLLPLGRKSPFLNRSPSTSTAVPSVQKQATKITTKRIPTVAPRRSKKPAEHRSSSTIILKTGNTSKGREGNTAYSSIISEQGQLVAGGSAEVEPTPKYGAPVSMIGNGAGPTEHRSLATSVTKRTSRHEVDRSNGGSISPSRQVSSVINEQPQHEPAFSIAVKTKHPPATGKEKVASTKKQKSFLNTSNSAGKGSSPSPAGLPGRTSIKLIGPERKSTSTPRRSLILGVQSRDEKSSKGSGKKTSARSAIVENSPTSSKPEKTDEAAQTPVPSMVTDIATPSFKITLKVRALPD